VAVNDTLDVEWRARVLSRWHDQPGDLQLVRVRGAEPESGRVASLDEIVFGARSAVGSGRSGQLRGSRVAPWPCRC
jgi:hypothetical protein